MGSHRWSGLWLGAIRKRAVIWWTNVELLFCGGRSEFMAPRSWFHPNCFGDFDISSSYIALYRGQWRGSLMCYLICAWINGWANIREAGYLRRIRAHYDVIVMIYLHRYAHWPRFKWISLAAVYTFRKDPHNVLVRIESIFNIKQSYLGVLTYICFVYSIF